MVVEADKKTKQQDKNNYPEWSDAIEPTGVQWEAIPFTTTQGYNLTLFHLLGANGQDFNDTRGPLMFQAGAFSETLDWLKRDDPSQLPVALNMATRGFDVWFSSGRGRTFSNTH